MKIEGKKGDTNILVQYVIFIVLNLVFISILLLFVFTKTGDAAVLEEKYSKQIALLIDAVEPGMVIHLDMEDAVNTATKKNIPVNEIVKITENTVTVKLEDGIGHSYTFFNDVEVTANFDTLNEKEYYFVISEK